MCLLIPNCSYGEQGIAIIELAVQTALGRRLFQLSPKVIAPASLTSFCRYILCPHVATTLIQEDYKDGITLNEAFQMQRKSHGYGVNAHPLEIIDEDPRSQVLDAVLSRLNRHLSRPSSRIDASGE